MRSPARPSCQRPDTVAISCLPKRTAPPKPCPLRELSLHRALIVCLLLRLLQEVVLDSVHLRLRRVWPDFTTSLWFHMLWVGDWVCKDVYALRVRPRGTHQDRTEKRELPLKRGHAHSLDIQQVRREDAAVFIKREPLRKQEASTTMTRHKNPPYGKPLRQAHSTVILATDRSICRKKRMRLRML